MNKFNLYRREADAEMWRKAEILAHKQHMSLSELVTEAIEAYCLDHDPEYARKFAEIMQRIEKLESYHKTE